MKQIITSAVCVLDPLKDLRGCHGISVHRGVLVLWDEDFDTRILMGIDMMDAFDRSQLFAAAESKGVVDLYWRRRVPAKYTTLDMFLEYDGTIQNHVVPIRGDAE